MMSKSDSFAEYLREHPDFQDSNASTSRLPSLYSDFSRHRQSDPAAFRSNVEWWRKLLIDVLKHGWQDESLRLSATKVAVSDSKDSKGKGREIEKQTSRLVLQVDEALKGNWTLDNIGIPLGLGTVILELERNGDFIAEMKFLTAIKPITGPRKKGVLSIDPRAIVSSAATSSLEWAMSQLGLGGSHDDDEETGEDAKAWRKAVKEREWICWEVLSEAVEVVIQEHYQNKVVLSPLDSLYTRADFREKLGGKVIERWSQSKPQGSVQLSEKDAEVLLKHLERDRRLVSVDKEIVKFAKRRDDQPTPVTEQDRNVLQLRETHATLEKQIAEIEHRMQDCTAKIKMYLRNKSQEQAKSYLRSRKMLEDVLAKRTSAAETLGGVLLKIEQAAGDAEIMAAYDLSAVTLKKLLADPSLKMERVEATMDNVAEAVADHNAIDEAIRGAVPSGREDIDEDEIMRELEELERQEQPNEQKVAQSADQMPSLPSAPAHDPVESTSDAAQEPPLATKKEASQRADTA